MSLNRKNKALHATLDDPGFMSAADKVRVENATGGTIEADSSGNYDVSINTLIDAASASAGGGVVTLRNEGSDILLGAPVILKSNVRLIGIGRPTLKLNTGANCSVIESDGFQSDTGTDTTGIENFQITGFILDGNSANNGSPASDSGHGIAVYGRDFLIEDILINDVKRTGLWTEYSDSGISPYNGRVNRVTVSLVGEHGWFNEVSDLHADSVNVRSCSQTTDNTYDAFRFTNAVRGTNLNCWRGGTETNTHRYGIYSEGGCILSNMSLETCKTNAIYLNGDNNRLENVWSYNLLGGDHILVNGDYNKVEALITTGGLGVSTDYGLVIGGTNVWASNFDITMSGTHAGVVNVVSSAGGNHITGRTRELNNPLVNGSPNASDVLDLTADGSTDVENISYKKMSGRPGTLAAAGSSSQGDAAAIEATITRVFSDNAVRGVRLPTCEPGLIFVLSNTGGNACEVYPASGEGIIGLSTNTSTTLAGDTSLIFIGMNNSEWSFK